MIDRVGTPRRFQVQLVNDFTRLAALAGPWETLSGLLSDHEAPFFQSYPWCVHVARTRLQRSGHRYRLCVAAIRCGDRLIGIWPLSLQRIMGAWIVKSLDEPFGQFAGVLFESRADIAPGVAAVLAALKGAGIADGLQLDKVIEGSPLHQALVESHASDTVTSDAVYVDMRDCSSFESYAEGINKKTRKNLRNLLNRLKRTADVKHTVAEDRQQIGAMLTQAFDARLDWMQQHARTSAAFRDPDFRALVEGLVAAVDVDLLGFSFASKDSELSTQWGFSYLGRYYAYMSGKNPRFDEFSPGRLHLGMVIEACKNRGIDTLELMAPASDYKMTWSDRTRRLHNVVMPFTIRGYILLNIFTGKLVPATRNASRLLPHAVRKRLLNPMLPHRVG